MPKNPEIMSKGGKWLSKLKNLLEVHKGVCKKSGLASELITRVVGELELYGQDLRIPHVISVNLVYSSFF